MIQDKFRGVGVAMITPFDTEGKIDFEALGRVIDYVIAGGAGYIVALGTTAETPTLYIPERAEIARFVRKRIDGRVPLVIGAGGNSTSEVLDQLREIDFTGADAVLSVTPYYNKPSQEGLYRHFRCVADASPLPVILYNIPGRSGVNMLPATTRRIARDASNVIGIKEASGDIEQIEQVIRERDSRDFLVLSGDDGMAVETIRRGGDGVISVAANLFPAQFTRCIDLAMAGDFHRAEEAFAPYGEVVAALFAEGNPTGIKCALTVKGLIGGTMRLPLVEGTPELREKFAKFIDAYDLH